VKVHQRHSVTPGANFATRSADVVDTGSKYATGVSEIGSKFAAGVNETSGKLLPVSMTLVSMTTAANNGNNIRLLTS
jgi:hypothetical protein